MTTKSIKSVECNRFKISLIQDTANRYVIKTETNVGAAYSESFKDFGMALSVFDLKLRDLQGN